MTPRQLRISAFMHGHGHPELAMKLNDKIPKTVDEMFERVREFIRAEVAAGLAEAARAPQWDKGSARAGWSGGQERIKRRNGPREFQRNKQIEEVVALRKLAHFVKDIRQGNQRNKGQGRGNVKVTNMVGLGRNRKRPHEMKGPRLKEEIAFPAIPRNSLTNAPFILEGTIEGFRVRRIYVDGGSSSEIMYEHCYNSFDVDTKSRLRKSNAPLVGFSGEIYHPLGIIDLRVTREEQNYAARVCHSEMSFTLQRHLGGTWMRSDDIK
ncbi:hypothetical protein Tco_0431914 [Tanacetum coccineum]